MTYPVSPLLEMLWETEDPQEVLRDRFGFTDAAAAARWIAATVVDHWHIDVLATERLVMSDRNALAWIATSDGPMLLKWSVVPERFVRLGAAARLTDRLGRAGLPVSAPVPTHGGCLQLEVDGASACLQRVVPGDLLDPDDGAQVHAAGAALARLHQALAEVPDHAGLTDDRTPPTPLRTRLTAWVDGRASHLPPWATGALTRLVERAPIDPLPVQLVHGDFRSANILCTGPVITAILDFEEMRLDHRVMELAGSSVLLGTRFRDWAPVSTDVHARLLAGYESVSPLSPVEAAWLAPLVLWRTLVSVPRGADPTGWLASSLSQVTRVEGQPCEILEPR